MTKNHGLKTRLITAYGLLALFSITTLTVVANLFLENRFTSFVENRITREKSNILGKLEVSWEKHRGWSTGELTTIGMAALEQGFLIRITDPDGAEIWDSRTHNHGLCQEMFQNLASTMDQRYKGWSGNYTEENHTFHGTVAIGYYGPFWFTEADLSFLGDLNAIIVAIAIIILAGAFVLGYLMAHGLAKPLEALTITAQNLVHHHRETTPPSPSGIREIDDLSQSLQLLARSLAQQEALRQRMVADISHELRTPLATMQGQVEAMVDGIWPRSHEHMEGILEEIQRLTRLVGQIEGLASTDDAITTIKSKILDLGDFTRVLGQDHGLLFSKKGINFITVIKEPVQLRTDPDMLKQILVNILSNAARYTDRGGTVTLSCQGSTLAVSDTGCGIPAEDLPHIFERFYRVDPSRSIRSGGAGLGLAIVANLVEALGSSIHVDSLPGKGSRFWINLGAATDPISKSQ